LIFYGKRERLADPAVLIRDAAARLEAALAHGRGIDRHQTAMGGFLILCEAIQGLADHAFTRDGEDRPPGSHATLGQWALGVAHALLVSWDTDFADLPALPPPPRLVPMPAEVAVRLPEGFAHYAVYPEAHALAARRLPPAPSDRVLGIRSIGIALGTLAAAALEAPPPFSVRPTGHPFDRRLAVRTDALDWVESGARIVIADEGPGLSGSSFAAAWRMARGAGVPDERIAFLPSHHGMPGPEASDAVKAAWAGRTRATVTFDDAIGITRLRRWVETLIGPLEAPLADITGGRWRALRDEPAECWPMADPVRERLKFLATAGGVRWLVKFAGLGDEAARKLARARTLADAGLGPRTAGIVHGFIVQQWAEGRPVAERGPGDVEQVARYIGRRARLLEPAPYSGATSERLVEMAEHNVREALGSGVAGRIPWIRHTSWLAGGHRAVAIDGRLDLCEWVRTGDGRLVKLDALDHDAAHDLIGPQDVAWDVAGAIVEWELDADARSCLTRVVAAETGREPAPATLEAMMPCYLAFRLGAAQLAADAAADRADAARARARTTIYADRLARLARG
jgi:hypothetical protein